jgi:hypothetical protein
LSRHFKIETGHWTSGDPTEISVGTYASIALSFLCRNEQLAVAQDFGYRNDGGCRAMPHAIVPRCGVALTIAALVMPTQQRSLGD